MHGEVKENARDGEDQDQNDEPKEGQQVEAQLLQEDAPGGQELLVLRPLIPDWS